MHGALTNKQVNVLPREIYNAETTAAVHAASSKFGHAALQKAFEVLKVG